jgi:hypothetical protein
MIAVFRDMPREDVGENERISLLKSDSAKTLADTLGPGRVGHPFGLRGFADLIPFHPVHTRLGQQ